MYIYPYPYLYPLYFKPGQLPPRAYLCPYCGHILYWEPRNRWLCPFHGYISKWKYRFI
jgi:hypothetical protein